MSKIAYICNRYPAVSNTFILQEVAVLRDLGIPVETISVRPPRPGDLMARADREEHARTKYLLPPRAAELLSAQLTALLSRPRRYLKTLVLACRLSPNGARARLWHLLYFAEAVMVWRHCRRLDVRHLHAHFAYVASDDALLAAHLGGWSWSFSMHGPPEFYDVRGTRLAAKVQRADAVICISDFCRSQLMGLVDEVHWAKLHVVRCGISTTRYARHAARNGSRGKAINVLTVARLVPVKGHAVLLDALGALAARGVDVELTWIGDGPERAALERRAAQLRVAHLVRMQGAVGQDDIRAEYERADIFCLPSFAEGLPVVLLEAMAMELPVVASQVMGIPELVEHGVSGLLVAPARPDLLADALELLIEAPDERASMGATGRAKVLADHDAARSGNALRNVYRELGVAA
jgi:colanic acid/amylovoran biosynthesis glycosyltransferase